MRKTLPGLLLTAALISPLMLPSLPVRSSSPAAWDALAQEGLKACRRLLKSQGYDPEGVQRLPDGRLQYRPINAGVVLTLFGMDRRNGNELRFRCRYQGGLAEIVRTSDDDGGDSMPKPQPQPTPGLSVDDVRNQCVQMVRDLGIGRQFPENFRQEGSDVRGTVVGMPVLNLFNVRYPFDCWASGRRIELSRTFPGYPGNTVDAVAARCRQAAGASGLTVQQLRNFVYDRRGISGEVVTGSAASAFNGSRLWSCRQDSNAVVLTLR